MMNDKLYQWLEKEGRFNNHKKYYKYFIEGISKITENQINGFQKMMDADYIQHI